MFAAWRETRRRVSVRYHPEAFVNRSKDAK
ncbi:MAG: hypothetical protein M3Y55_16280 [Pseudomonadota bacterium]|nr:hypothetical protein [Pseudomonadota bacterium]MDQ2764938.1 hypothetical protein [Pseudomonadota bacterium]